MYAIIGADGFVGSYVIKAILEMTDEKVIATARDLEHINKHERVQWISCDVQNDTSVDNLIKIFSGVDTLAIVYLAAYHHPDKVEQNKELAWDTNVTSLSKFLNKTKFAKNFFYASTDSVYGDSINDYHFKETDALKPVNFYGHNKCAAEALIIHIGRNVVRFPFLISPSIVHKPHFYDVIVENIKAGKSFEMFGDSYRSTLSLENAGRLLVELMEKESVPQIINVCGDRDLSKYDVGLMIAEREGVDKSLIIPISIDKPQENFITKRAITTLMDNSILKETLSIKYVDIFDSPIRN